MSERLAKRVLLIGWDAADWQLIRPLIDQGKMPNFKRFLDEGAWGNIATLQPVLSPILWNSIATGKRADKHEILGFLEPDGEGFVRPVSSSSRKAKAIWNIASQHDLRSIVVGWYASYPAEKIKGSVITDRFESFVDESDKFFDDENAYHPHTLREELRDLHLNRNDIVLDQVKPFIPEVESIDTSKDPRVGVFAHMLAQCGSIHNAATHLLEKKETWDFAAVYYTAIDHFGHAFQEFHPPKMEHVDDEQFRLYRNVISEIYQYHDLMLGRLLELAGPETTVLLMSDHGFKSGTDRPKIHIDPESGKRSGPGVDPVSWHRQQGVLAAMGPGIARQREVTGVSLLDICPTVLTLLGLSVGDDMDGNVIKPLFETPPTIERVVTYEDEHPDDGVFRGEQLVDPYAAQEALKQLIDLGYVDAPGGNKELVLKSTLRGRDDALATVLSDAGRFLEAMEILRKLVDENPDTVFRYRLCHVLGILGRENEIEEVLKSVADDPEYAPMLTMFRGKQKLANGDAEDAIGLFQKVLEQTPDMPRIRCLLARPLIRFERYDEARQVLDEALEINSEDAEAWNLYGLTLRGGGDPEEAVKAFMKSVAIDHQQVAAHVNLGVTLMKLQQWDWAIRAFETALKIRPNNPVAHRGLGRIYKNVKGDAFKGLEHMDAADAARKSSSTREDAEKFDHTQW